MKNNFRGDDVKTLKQEEAECFYKFQYIEYLRCFSIAIFYKYG